MVSNSFLYLLISAATTSIGALPFGLVNLSVVEETVKRNVRSSMPLAYGAAFVEIIFAVAAIFAGTLMSDFLGENKTVKIIILVVLIVSGIFFWFKKGKMVQNKKYGDVWNGFLKGAFLNLISIQVFLFWLFAIAILSAKDLLPESSIQVSLFVTGVGIAKISVLFIYAQLGQKVAYKFMFFSQNINRIIGVVLFAAALIQIIKL